MQASFIFLATTFPVQFNKSVLPLQSRHYSHTGRCYVISFGVGERLDVIITITKYMQCSVQCPPGKRKVGGPKFFVPPQTRGAAPGLKQTF